jgi:hypothetical protein
VIHFDNSPKLRDVPLLQLPVLQLPGGLRLVSFETAKRLLDDWAYFCARREESASGKLTYRKAAGSSQLGKPLVL